MSANRRSQPTSFSASYYQQSGNICKHVRAVVLFEQRQTQPAPAARSKYESLFAGCRDCGDLADGLDGRCSKCASDREWRLRREAQRVLVANA